MWKHLEKRIIIRLLGEELYTLNIRSLALDGVVSDLNKDKILYGKDNNFDEIV